MKSPVIMVPVNREAYRVFAAASYLLHKQFGDDAPDAVALIQFQLAHRTAIGLAKEYMDCIGDFAGRRNIRRKTTRGSARRAKLGGRLGVLRAVPTPKDPSRN